MHGVLALADLTTLRLGGPTQQLVTAHSTDELVTAVEAADDRGEPVLLVGGGSNLVVSDDGWPGTTIVLRSSGWRVDGDAVEVDAGEGWDEVVARCVADGLAGIECLAGIPGLTGATPVQNVGAYGQEVAQTLSLVRVWDRASAEVRELGPDECGFAYRTSIFKHSERYVVLSVRFALTRSKESMPIQYAELARTLGVEIGATVPVADCRSAVLELRRGKGMVLDADDHDTWSAGSFFTNPVLSATELADFESRVDGDFPRFPDPGGVKLSAAWLIEHAGFTRGSRRDGVGLSTKHTLALTNRGTGTTTELITLAREVRDGVRARFGVDLRPEPKLVGVTL